MNILVKVISGDEFRKTRLHDMKGNRVSFVDVTLHTPRSLVSYISEKAFGYRSATPWIPYHAAKAIGRALAPNARAIEFGSGMSTLWLASRCSFLHSIENDARWFQFISKRLACIDHVRYEQRGPEEYANVQEHADESLDFALIDGIRRAQCVAEVVPKLRTGGMLYLDNSDADPSAEEQVLRALALRKGTRSYFTDYCPRLLHPNEGLLVQFDA